LIDLQRAALYLAASIRNPTTGSTMLTAPHVAPVLTAPGQVAVELELGHSQLELLVQTLKAAAEASR
jgi:hypothetical protein